MDNGLAPSASRPHLSTEVLRSADQWTAPTVVAAWNALCDRHGGIEVLFQSPEWFAHVGRSEPDSRKRVIVVRDRQRAIVALGALHFEDIELKFDVGARELGRFAVRGPVLLGGEPLAPRDRAIHDAFFSALVGELGGADCLTMPMLPRDSFFRGRVDEWVRAHHEFFLYAPAIPGAGRIHALSFDGSFDEYARTHFTSKQRGNIKRRLKALEHALGPLELRRFSAPEDVAPFLADAEQVSKLSWQYATVGPHIPATESWQDKLVDLANGGVLRSYILYAADRPLAFVLGYQRSDVLCHVKTGYDRSLAKLAPGIAVLWLLLEDLSRIGRPQRINFMFGDTEYKREFANVHVESDELMMMPRTLTNALRCGAHAAFRSGVTFARDRIRRVMPLRRTTSIEHTTNR